MAVSASLPGGAISVMRWMISNEIRWGGRRLRRPEMALTCRFIVIISCCEFKSVFKCL
jgi:hypothetical protein